MSREAKLQNRQFRKMLPLENKEKDYIVEGYAMKYQPYELMEDEEGIIYEEFRKEAFENADMTDVIFLYDHQGKVFARTSNETLQVKFDDVGMYITADLSKSESAREMYNEIQAGLVTKMSWSFRTGDYHFDKKTRTIVHDSIRKVYDVSAVGIPANNDTEINARKFIDGVINEFEAERLKEQKQRKKIQLKIKLEMERK
ncbi:HK97 family phage prohead protease [Helcococcus ovis]|uniref:HK97 family phage prohead protease n=1 Tax=Helcococcus ovis TaxID=72026 RepID=UPI0038BAB8FD